MKGRLRLAVTRLNEAWVCRSTALLYASAELVELAADVLSYQSRRLHAFTRRRIGAYVERYYSVRPIDENDEAAPAPPPETG